MVDLEGGVVFIVVGEGEQHVYLVNEVCDTSTETVVWSALAKSMAQLNFSVQKSDSTQKLTPTNLVSVLSRYTETRCGCSSAHKKDVHMVDNEEALVVRVDVERIVREHVGEHVDVRVVCVSVDWIDIDSPSW